MFTVAQCVIRDGRVFFCEYLWEAVLRTVRALVYVTFFYTTQSTAGPGIVSVHKCHHQKHELQSTHADALEWGGGVVRGIVRLANAFKRREKKRSPLYVLSSMVVRILHFLDPSVRRSR